MGVRVGVLFLRGSVHAAASGALWLFIDFDFFALRKFHGAAPRARCSRSNVYLGGCALLAAFSIFDSRDVRSRDVDCLKQVLKTPVNMQSRFCY